MDLKYLYFFRGLIAFVAFSDLGTAIKAFVENKCVLNEISASSSVTTSRVYGMYTILQALIMIHCTLFIHHKPLISMGICSLILSIAMHVSVVLIFQSSAYDFRIVFPCSLNGITILGLLFTLFRRSEGSREYEEENMELLKKSRLLKKKEFFNKMR